MDHHGNKSVASVCRSVSCEFTKVRQYSSGETHGHFSLLPIIFKPPHSPSLSSPYLPTTFPAWISSPLLSSPATFAISEKALNGCQRPQEPTDFLLKIRAEKNKSWRERSGTRKGGKEEREGGGGEGTRQIMGEKKAKIERRGEDERAESLGADGNTWPTFVQTVFPNQYAQPDLPANLFSTH